MSNTLRPFESYLDEVAQKYGHKDFDTAIAAMYRYENLSRSKAVTKRIVDEAMHRMCEDAFKGAWESRHGTWWCKLLCRQIQHPRLPNTIL